MWSRAVLQAAGVGATCFGREGGDQRRAYS